MKNIQIILVAALAFFQTIAFGQTELAEDSVNATLVKATHEDILFVLKAGSKVLEFTGPLNLQSDVDAITPSSIEAIAVLKGAEAIEAYGDRGKNGVIIITLKNFKQLPKELRERFSEVE